MQHIQMPTLDKHPKITSEFQMLFLQKGIILLLKDFALPRFVEIKTKRIMSKIVLNIQRNAMR